jgi:dTDP-4-dehydrorhamnose 3,5-epimerase
MRIEDGQLSGLKIVTPDVFKDNRGYFMETYRQDQFQSLGLPGSFVQQNHSGSRRGVLRGLHFQWDPPQGKLMRVIRGLAYLVAVDIRKGSPTLGRWQGMVVTSRTRKQIWAPAGFARGFYVRSAYAEVQYLCTGVHNAAAESAIRWDDPDIGIDWGLRGQCILSEKDRTAQSLAAWLQRPESDTFRYTSNLAI